MYQKGTPTSVINIFKSKNVNYCHIDYYAWPQSFGDTTGPRGGIGGQMISSFTVHAYVADGGPTVYVCAGMFIFKDEPFIPMKSVKGRWIKINRD